MGLPELFVKWIQGCITTAAFSVSINGETAGFFGSSRGIRQGCSLSPYLFDIANNVLSLMLNRAALTGTFGYHDKCKEVGLTHLSFADDMLIFTDGTPQSLDGVIQVLQAYESISGLAINPSKSSIFLGGTVRQDTMGWIQQNGLQLESLPIRYLGLPLTTKSMVRSDYEPLLDRIRTRLNSWTNRFLSYSGRLQLIKSVITSIANFWCSVFRLPQRCLDRIESMCAAFLWSGTPTVTTKSKIAWKDICLPKNEGGLGIRRLRDSSIAYSLSLIWRLLTSKNSYWVVWTKHYLLRYSSFWDVRRHTRGSWIWNKLLKLRPIAASFLRHDIGNGRDTFFWLDNWLGYGSLIQLVGEVGPSIMGIARSARVADVVCEGVWQLRYFRNRAIREHVEQIRALPVPHHTRKNDELLWKCGDKYQTQFSMKHTWCQLRRRAGNKVWTKLVWNSMSIPRYSFIAWLALQNRLPTGERAGRWGHTQQCSFCGDPNESREHLFFACGYSASVWSQLTSRLMGSNATTVWQEIVTWLQQHNAKEETMLVILLFQSVIYQIWRERNGRNHGQSATPSSALVRTIKSMTLLQLRAHFPNQQEREASRLWNQSITLI